jgi:hypothetical protein
MFEKRGIYLIKRYLCSAARSINEEAVKGKSINRMTGKESSRKLKLKNNKKFIKKSINLF